MNKVKLTDICSPKQWKTIPTSELREVGYPVYGANGIIGFNDTYNHEEPVITIGCRGTCGVVKITQPKSYVTGNAMCLDNLSSKVYLKYMYYVLLNYDFNKIITGIAQPQITRTNLAKVEIPLYPKTTQQEIVAILDVISKTIETEKHIFSSYDELIKSRFIELFEKIKTTKEMSSICKIITDGTHQPPIFSEKGIPFLFVTNIKSNEIDYNTQKYITKEIYDVLVKRTPIEKGDILLSTVGSYGHPAIVKSSQPFCFQRHIAYLKPDVEQVNSIYLHSAILTDNIQNQIEDNVNGVAQKTLNLSAIKKIKVPIPPLALQNSFAAFVQEIDKLKFISQKKIQYLEELLSKQMDTYFG